MAENGVRRVIFCSCKNDIPAILGGKAERDGIQVGYRVVGGVCLQTAIMGRHLFEMPPTGGVLCCGRRLLADASHNTMHTCRRHLEEMATDCLRLSADASYKTI